MDKKSGFSLVELLVVISIMAIIGAIALTIFSGARQKANDGKRKSEVKSIADSIETNKNFTSRIYTYNSTARDVDFPNGFPEDPSSSTKYYCISTSTTSYTPPDKCTGWGAGTCPAATNCNSVVYGRLSTSITTGTTGNLGATTPDVKSWTICAFLEKETAPFCISSSER